MSNKMETLLGMWIDDKDTVPDIGCAGIRFKLKDDQMAFGGIISRAEKSERTIDGVYAIETQLPSQHPESGQLIVLQTTMYVTADDFRWIARQQDEVIPSMESAFSGKSPSGLVVPSS